MRVVYDIAYLGAGAEHGDRQETGVGRVCRNVLAGLAQSPELELTLSASEFVHGGRVYARDHGLEPRFAGPDTWVGGALNRWLPELHRRWRVGQRSDAAGGRTLGQRVAGRCWRRLARLPTAALNRRALAAADIFHSSHYPLPAQVRAVASLRRFITVCDVLPLLHPEWFEPGINAFFRRVAASIDPATWVIAISESTKRDVCATLPVPPRQVFVASPAAEPRLFSPVTDTARLEAVRRQYGIPAGPYLLSVCTLEPRKGLATVIRAFGALVGQAGLRDLSLVLVGNPGWHPARLEAVLATMPVGRERVLRPGYVPDTDLAPLYSGALAFTYLSEYEGFGLPPLEAMQCGLPVIAANSAALPEVVGDAGVLLPPGDEAGLAEAMLALYRQPEKRAALAARALARAAGFSWDRCVCAVIKAYRASLDG